MQNAPDIQAQLLSNLHRFYRELDRAVSALTALHGSRLKCAYGCTGCCVDDLTVFEVEAKNIRAHYPGRLEPEDAHPPGGCAFLDDTGGCRIYGHRPYVCRTQGLPLRWIEEAEDESILEMRDICPVNDDGPAVETLPADTCWEIGPYESHLARLQQEFGGEPLKRVFLRDIFSRMH